MIIKAKYVDASQKAKVRVASFFLVPLLIFSTYDVHSQDTCGSRFTEALNSISSMRAANIAWYSDAIYSIGVLTASEQLKPKTDVTNQLSTEASTAFYKCQRSEREAKREVTENSDDERIDKVIDEAQKISKRFLPAPNDSNFQEGSDVLRDIWKNQFKDLSRAFRSTDSWNSPSNRGSSVNQVDYQSRIFSSQPTIVRRPEIAAQQQVDTQSTAYLDQLESVSNSLDNTRYNEIVNRGNINSSRRESRIERERERYRQEHELLMQRLDAVSSSRTTRQPTQGSGTTTGNNGSNISCVGAGTGNAENIRCY